MSTAEFAARVPCPCCGYPTLTQRAAYEVCALCCWEDDGQGDQHAEEVWGGPNHGYSLAEARTNFRQFFVMYPPETDRRVGGGNTEAEQSTKRALIEAFDSLATCEPTERGPLIAQVRTSERELRRLLKQRIAAWEAEVTKSRQAAEAATTGSASA